MLETVREYAWERLAAAGELTAARRAHAHHFLALAERADPALRGHDQRAWIFRLEREHDNVRAALRWFLDQDALNKGFKRDAAAEWEAGLRLAGALGYFWSVRGYHAEGRRWLEETRARVPEGVESAARNRGLIAAGPLLMVQADYARSRAVLTEALRQAERRQDSLAIAESSTYLGHATVVWAATSRKGSGCCRTRCAAGLRWATPTAWARRSSMSGTRPM
jgi:non-specific serine/threonine protein kinase